MLRIVNPFLGKAFMAHNPRKKRKKRLAGVLGRTRKYRKLRSSSKRRFSTKSKRGKASMITFGRKRRAKARRNPRRRRNFALTATATRARSILPTTKELSAEGGTMIVGLGVFTLSNALGVGANKVFERVVQYFPTLGGMGGLVGVMKFAIRYIGARALSKTVFKESKGILSVRNGALVKEIVVITGGIALLRDFGIVGMLPQAIQEFVPQISGMSALERMGLQAYPPGTPRTALAAYEQFRRGRWDRLSPPFAKGISKYVHGGTLSKYVEGGTLSGHLDTMPLETFEQPAYGVPYGH